MCPCQNIVFWQLNRDNHRKVPISRLSGGLALLVETPGQNLQIREESEASKHETINTCALSCLTAECLFHCPRGRAHLCAQDAGISTKSTVAKFAECSKIPHKAYFVEESMFTADNQHYTETRQNIEDIIHMEILSRFSNMSSKSC